MHSEDDDLGVGDARRGEERGKVKFATRWREREEGFNTRVRTPPRLFGKVPVPGSSTTIMGPAIALLICGGLTGMAKERNGDYLDLYQAFLKDTSRTDFTLDPYFVARDPSVLPDEDQYDSIVITGSGIVSLSLTNLALMLYPSHFPHAQTVLYLFFLPFFSTGNLDDLMHQPRMHTKISNG